MITAFDHIAADYDRTFTDTATGLLQRKVVHDYLRNNLSRDKLGILEINCGTGIDAAFLSSLGHQVTACDVSGGMIDVAREKYAGRAIEFVQAGFSEMDIFPEEQYDLIFSDFGGLNCIEREGLGILLEDLYKKLKPGGRMILVVMGKFCMWESLYFLFKGNRGNILRRMRNGATPIANIGGEEIEVYYYSPKDLLHKNLKIKRIKPVGTTVPPSYLDNFFTKHPRWLKLLERMDNLFGRIGVMAHLSDHFLIDLEKPVST